MWLLERFWSEVGLLELIIPPSKVAGSFVHSVLQMQYLSVRRPFVEWLTQRLKFSLNHPPPHQREYAPGGRQPRQFPGNFTGFHIGRMRRWAQENMFCTACCIMEDRHGFKVRCNQTSGNCPVAEADSARSATAEDYMITRPKGIKSPRFCLFANVRIYPGYAAPAQSKNTQISYASLLCYGPCARWSKRQYASTIFFVVAV
jgi:hypothetical protein